MSKATSKTTTRRKKLMDLDARDCRWPIGEPREPDFHFCAAPRSGDRPYCEKHWQMAFQPARPRQQAPQQAAAPAPARTAKAA